LNKLLTLAFFFVFRFRFQFLRTAPKHRGFAFITFSSQADAQDAIDNMDLNELKGKVLRVNLARPMKAALLNPQGNRASAFSLSLSFPVFLVLLNADGFTFSFFLL